MKKILIVDDHEQFRVSLSEALREMEDVTVLECDSGNDAVKVAESQRPDIIIMDILMPGMDGWEAALEIRLMPGLEETPVIYCSGSYQDEMKFASASPARSAFLAKPISVEKLFDLIEGLLPGACAAAIPLTLPTNQNL